VTDDVNRPSVRVTLLHVLQAHRPADDRSTMADLTDKPPVTQGNSSTGIGPVERDCICLQRTADGPHIAECDQRFKAKFFGAWRAERFLFYGR
jgi:hypothetical protein